MLNKIKKVNLDILIPLSLFLHILFFFYLFINGGYFDFQLPVEVREYASTSSILSFLNNKNPFAIENFPIAINAYSALHPFIVGKVLEFFNIQEFKNIVLIARFISLSVFCIFIIYFFINFYKKKIELSLILFLIIFFIISVFSKISLGTWGNGIGLVLYSISILKVLDKSSRINYLTSSIFLILSIHFKFYFILGFLFILMRYYNKILKKDYIYSNIIIIFISIFIFYIHYIYFPSFYFVSILNQINLTEFKEFEFLTFIFSKKLYSELFFAFKNYFYLFILFFYSIFLSFKQDKLQKKRFLIDTVFFFIFMYFLMFKLWPNTGNHGTYTNNLLIPFIIAYIINNQVKYRKLYLNIFIIIVLIVPLTTPIFNFNHPGTLTKNEQSLNILSKKKIIDELSTNQNIYIDHFIKNLDYTNTIDEILYFNGNTLHITENSILSYQNSFIQKIFKLEDLYYYYKKNKHIALDEINKNYSGSICVFVCFNSSLGYDFDVFNYKKYELEEKVEIINIFGQSYKVNIFRVNNEKR